MTKTTKNELEVILDVDAVKKWDHFHPEMEKNLGQLLLELGEGLLNGTAPPLKTTEPSGFEIQLGGHVLGTVLFTPAGTDLEDEIERLGDDDGIETSKTVH